MGPTVSLEPLPRTKPVFQSIDRHGTDEVTIAHDLHKIPYAILTVFKQDLLALRKFRIELNMLNSLHLIQRAQNRVKRQRHVNLQVT
jgi:hypothetical protein